MQQACHTPNTVLGLHWKTHLKSLVEPPLWVNQHGKPLYHFGATLVIYTGFLAEGGGALEEREIKQVWLSHCPGPGSCSPRGWASCLLGMLGAFLSGALSAEAGLYLRSMCQGEYSDRAKLVKKLLLNLTLCGLTQCTNNVMLKSKLRALKQNVPIVFFWVFF